MKVVEYQSKDKQVEVVSETNKYGTKYFIRFRTIWFFYFKGWQYVLTSFAKGVLVYRPFLTIESAFDYIERHFKSYNVGYEFLKENYIKKVI